MGRPKCKNCDNDRHGTNLYRCKNCEKIYCADCLPRGQCGNCGEAWFPTMGSMLPFTSDNLDSFDYIENKTDYNSQENTDNPPVVDDSESDEDFALNAKGSSQGDLPNNEPSDYASSGSYSSSESGGFGGSIVIIVVGILIALWFGSQSNNKTPRETVVENNTRPPPPPSPTIPHYSGETGVVNTPGDGFLALRRGPSSSENSQLLIKIPHATPLNIGECRPNSELERWCKTTYQGQTGWVLERYIVKEDKTHKNTSTVKAITPPKGSADRKAILDVIRAEYSQPVIFEVLHLKNSGNWAWATVRPKSADGKEGYYEDESVLLERIGNKWQKVDGLDHGADCGEEYCPEIDIAALQRRHPGAPASIFE